MYLHTARGIYKMDQAMVIINLPLSIATKTTSVLQCTDRESCAQILSF